MASMTQKMEDYRESVRANLASEAERRQKEVRQRIGHVMEVLVVLPADVVLL